MRARRPSLAELHANAVGARATFVKLAESLDAVDTARAALGAASDADPPVIEDLRTLARDFHAELTRACEAAETAYDEAQARWELARIEKAIAIGVATNEQRRELPRVRGMVEAFDAARATTVPAPAQQGASAGA